MHNKLHIGLTRSVTLPEGGCLFIDDETPDIPKETRDHLRKPPVLVFDPKQHSFNPLAGIDHRKAREISDVLYTIYPQGENTLTVRNGRRALMRELVHAKRLDKIDADEEVQGLVDDILASPTLRRVFCETPNFSLSRKAVILARLNRAELGEFDALVLGLFLMAHFKGQVVVPDFGFYGRDAHVSLVREGRLIAGVNFLSELSPKLRRSVLLITDKEASGATYEDAVTLAQYARLAPETNAYNDFIAGAMS